MPQMQFRISNIPTDMPKQQFWYPKQAFVPTKICTSTAKTSLLALIEVGTWL
jgi:hypothetical protein